MTQNRTIIHGAIQSSASVILAMAALLVVGKLVTNAPGLDIATVGQFFLIQTTADLLILFLGFGLPNTLPKLIATTTPSEERALLRSTWTYQSLWALLLSAPLVLAPRLLPAHPDPEHVWSQVLPLLPLVPGLLIVGLLRDLFLAAMAGRNAFGQRAVAIIINACAQVGLFLIVLFGMNGGLSQLVYALITAYALGTLFLFFTIPGIQRPSFDWPHYSAALRFSVPLYLNSLLTFIYLRFDLFLVTKYLGFVEAGIYEIAKRIPMILSRLVNSLLVPYLPAITQSIRKNDTPAATTLLNHTLGIIAFLCYLGSFCAIALNTILIEILFSPEYLPAAAVLSPLLMGISLAIQAGVLSQTFIALDKPKIITWANGMAMLLSIGLNLLLLPRLGLMGAGYAYLAAGIFTFAFQCVLLWRSTVQPRILHVLLTQGLALGTYLLLHAFPNLFLQGVVILIFAGACIGTGIVLPQDIKKSVQLIRRTDS